MTATGCIKDRDPEAEQKKGGSMEMGKCGKPATYKITWITGKELNFCEHHEQQVRALCNHMGWPITIRTMGLERGTCEAAEDKL